MSEVAALNGAAAADSVFPLPDALSFEAGAALPMNYLTAQFTLAERAGLREGDVILPGSPHAMVSINPGDVFRAEFAHLGPVTVRFSKEAS